MAEPTDPKGDWLSIVGAKDAITVSPYRPATDDFGTPIAAFGHHGTPRVEFRSTGDGEVRVTTATWHLTGDDLTTRPPLLSKIIETSGAAWIVEQWTPDARGEVFTAEAVLLV